MMPRIRKRKFVYAAISRSRRRVERVVVAAGVLCPVLEKKKRALACAHNRFRCLVCVWRGRFARGCVSGGSKTHDRV